MKEILVSGMHCEACKKLVLMELENAGLSNAVSEIRLLENERGALVLPEGVSDEQESAVKEVINKMDNYSVL